MKRTSAVLATCVALSAVLFAGGSVGAARDADGFRLGGSFAANSPIWPAFAASGLLDLFAGVGDWEVHALTDLSVIPYTIGEEAFRLILTREWLSVGAEYRFSILPLGISSATITARATPPHLVEQRVGIKTDLGIDAEARLKGDSFAFRPQRIELHLTGSGTVTLSHVVIDEIVIGSSLEATASDPHGERVWWTTTARLGGTFGCVSLESETTFSLLPSRLDSEVLTLEIASTPPGLSAYAKAGLAAPDFTCALEVGLSWTFGDPSLAAPATNECSGGVCTDGF